MRSDKEILINKWLNNDLSPKEFDAIKQLDDYADYAKISDKAKYFKAPQYNQKAALEQLNFATTSRKESSKFTTIKFVAAIAAIALIVFTLFKTFFTASDLQSYQTDTAITELVKLPDHSKVSLNANSTLSYNKMDWGSKRELHLDGEALFEVEKGQTFTVNTSYAKVEVLGTVFNVRSRDYFFQVTCYEGAVKVTIDQKPFILKPNDLLVMEDDKISVIQNQTDLPDWKLNKTLISSQSLDIVLKEFQNYYDVNFDTSNVNTSKIYSGSFPHNNLKSALNSITLPLGLTYSLKGSTVILSSK